MDIIYYLVKKIVENKKLKINGVSRPIILANVITKNWLIQLFKKY